MTLFEHKATITQLYFEEGRSYQAIADQYDVSREAIRQFLNKNYPDRESGIEYRKRIVRENNEVKRIQHELTLTQGAISCIVCGSLVVKRGKRKVKTCTMEHSQLWAKARVLLDTNQRDRQRLTQARSILKHRKDRSDRLVDWAKNILNGSLIVHPRFKPRTNSEIYLAYEEVLRIRKENNV